MKQALIFFSLAVSVSYAENTVSEEPLPLSVPTSVEAARANAAALSGSRVNVYGYLSSIPRGDEHILVLLPSAFEGSFPSAVKKQVGMRVNAWEGADLSECIDVPVSIAGTYFLESIRDPNAFSFDSVSAEVVHDLQDDVPCGMISTSSVQ